VAISLVAIASGFGMLYAMTTGKRLSALTGLFLATTALTRLTGSGFPFEKFLPSHAIGIISLLLLAAAGYALYARKLVGTWRLIYVMTAVMSLYLNVFVLVVQSFLKIPVLKPLAPHQTEPPFAISQLVVLAAFIALGTLAAKRFRV